MAVVQVWAAVLITYGVSTGIAQIYPLDMALTSVDDMYEGCSGEIKSQVNNYLENEIRNNNNFKEAWDIAEKAWKEYNRQKMKEQKPSIMQKLKLKQQQAQIRPLEKEQFKAIYAYTLAKPPIYRDINQAVRTEESQYTTTFRYHALHFFLTRAIQTLNAKEAEKKRCLTTYRRVNGYFRQVLPNKRFRFGSFTSSSKERYPAKNFGVKSCFKIITCLGADIERYSLFGEQEREVLIPPYETFEVININMGTSTNKDESCEVIYEVKSTGAVSRLNCALIKNEE